MKNQLMYNGLITNNELKTAQLKIWFYIAAVNFDPWVWRLQGKTWHNPGI
jgi:hypothetical protein